MSVAAVMKTGGVVVLSPEFGDTPEKVAAHIGAQTGSGSLTGSAVQWVKTIHGDYVRADQIERLHLNTPRT